MSTVKAAATSGAKDALKKVTGHWAFWVVLAVVVIIIGWKLSKKAGTWWRNITARNTADTSGQNVNAQDLAKVKLIAKELHAQLNNWWTYDSTAQAAAVNQALGLNATELIALAKEYKNINDGTSLLEDLHSETYNTEAEKRLIARLNEVGVAKSLTPRIEAPEPEDTSAEYGMNVTNDKS